MTEARYCSTCGRRLVTVRRPMKFQNYCTKCGSRIWAMYKECPGRHEYWGLFEDSHTKLLDTTYCEGCDPEDNSHLTREDTSYWYPKEEARDGN